MHMSYCGGLLCLLSALSTHAAQLDVYIDDNPPFAMQSNGTVHGLYPDVLNKLGATQGLNFRFHIQPFRQSIDSAQNSPSACVLPIDYAPDLSETLGFVARVISVYPTAYARYGEIAPLKTVGDLKRYRVISYPFDETLKDTLKTEGVRYETPPRRSSGYDLLLAKRYDILLADHGPGLRSKTQGHPLSVVLSLGQIDLWLACNRGTPQDTLNRLRTILLHGFISETVAPIWDSYGAGDLYKQMRHDWGISH